MNSNAMSQMLNSIFNVVSATSSMSSCPAFHTVQCLLETYSAKNAHIGVLPCSHRWQVIGLWIRDHYQGIPSWSMGLAFLFVGHNCSDFQTDGPFPAMQTWSYDIYLIQANFDQATAWMCEEKSHVSGTPMIASICQGIDPPDLSYIVSLVVNTHITQTMWIMPPPNITDIDMWSGSIICFLFTPSQVTIRPGLPRTRSIKSPAEFLGCQVQLLPQNIFVGKNNRYWHGPMIGNGPLFIALGLSPSHLSAIHKSI